MATTTETKLAYACTAAILAALQAKGVILPEDVTEIGTIAAQVIPVALAGVVSSEGNSVASPAPVKTVKSPAPAKPPVLLKQAGPPAKTAKPVYKYISPGKVVRVS